MNSEDYKNIITAISSEPHTLDPRYAVSAVGMRLADLLFQPLVRLGPQLELQPAAAHEWRVEGKNYYLKVPKSFRFSNGRKLSKEDILFSFQEYQSEKSPFSSAFQVIENLKVRAEQNHWQIHIQLKQASAKFLKADLPVLKLLPKKETLAGMLDSQDSWTGSGSFKLKEKNSRRIILAARSDAPHPPWVKTVEFKIIRDELTRFQKILNGEVDISPSDLPPRKLKRLIEKNIKVIKSPGLSTTYLLINFKDPCLRKKPVRQALALALNRKEIVQYKFYGFAQIALSLLNPNHPFFNQNLKPVSFDLQKSRKLYKTLSPLCRKKTYVLKNSHQRFSAKLAQALALQARRAGFKMKTESLEWASFHGALNAGRFQLAFLNWTGVVDPDIYRLAFHSREQPPLGRNRGFYTNKVLDKLLIQGSQTMDLKARKSLYDQVQSIVHQDLAVIPLWHRQNTIAVKENISGYKISPTGDFSFLFTLRKKL